MVLGKNPLRDEALFVMMSMRVRMSMRWGADWCVSRRGHVIQLRDSFVGLNLQGSTLCRAQLKLGTTAD